MKKIALIVLLSCGAFTGFFQPAMAANNEPVVKGLSQEQLAALTPRQALDKLKEGNERFASNKMRHYDYAAITDAVETKQFPFAIVLSCIDSRSIPDLVFDQGLGNIFAARVAGNVISTNMLGSMEYATNYVGSKVVVVMGHSNCGAVKGACAGVGSDNLKKLLNEIQPAVQKVDKTTAKDCKDSTFINNVIKQNVVNQVNSVYKDSPKIRELVDTGKVLLVGAVHNLSTDKVDFFYEHAAKGKS